MEPVRVFDDRQTGPDWPVTGTGSISGLNKNIDDLTTPFLIL
jgi:hypothetical protein